MSIVTPYLVSLDLNDYGQIFTNPKYLYYIRHNDFLVKKDKPSHFQGVQGIFKGFQNVGVSKVLAVQGFEFYPQTHVKNKTKQTKKAPGCNVCFVDQQQEADS